MVGLPTGAGPGFGYFANGRKTRLVVKPEFLQSATEIFRDTDIIITAEGCRYLGAPLGTLEFMKSFVEKKVTEWNVILSTLSGIAESQRMRLLFMGLLANGCICPRYVSLPRAIGVR